MKLLEYFKNWTGDRYFRLIIAAIIALFSIFSKNYGFLFLSAWFLFMAIANISCCGAGGCNTSVGQKDMKNEDTFVDYEEIK